MPDAKWTHVHVYPPFVGNLLPINLLRSLYKLMHCIVLDITVFPV